MKKLLLFLSASLMVLSSCSNENPSTTSESPVLLKKMVVTPQNGDQYTVTYNYDGNKIKNMTSSMGGSQEYTYTGDLVTGIKIYNNEGALLHNREFVYEGNKLSQEISPGLGRSVYTYNADGTVSNQDYDKDNSGVEVLSPLNSKYHFAKGNRIKDEYFSGNNKTESTVATFDDKKNALANVVGLDKLIGLGHQNKNNTLTRTTETDNGDKTVVTVSYKYNEKGYPTEYIRSSVQGDGTPTVSTTQYFYE